MKRRRWRKRKVMIRATIIMQKIWNTESYYTVLESLPFYPPLIYHCVFTITLHFLFVK